LAVVTAVGAIHAGEPVVRIAALEEALDDALFEQPLQGFLRIAVPLGGDRRIDRAGSRAACAADTRRLLASCPPFARSILT